MDYYLIYNDKLKNSETWKPKFLKIIKNVIKNITTDKTRLNTALKIDIIKPSKKGNGIDIAPTNSRTYYTVPKQFVVKKSSIGSRKIRKYTISKNSKNKFMKLFYEVLQKRRSTS